MDRLGTDDVPDVLVGRYTIGDQLARGGMGEVRTGHDERLGRDVAVKFLHPERAAQPGARERFDVEARAAARLLHPNVVTVYDFGEDGDVPFLVMDHATAVWVSLAISILAHFAIGAARSLFTGRGIWVSGRDMFLVGFGVAAVGYVIGELITRL